MIEEKSKAVIRCACHRCGHELLRFQLPNLMGRFTINGVIFNECPYCLRDNIKQAEEEESK